MAHNCTDRISNFLKILKFFGFIPFKLQSDERNYPKLISFGVISSVVGVLLLFRWYLVHSELELVVQFLWDVATLIIDQINTYATRKRFIKLLTLFSEMDYKMSRPLRVQDKLQKAMIQLDRKILYMWIGYIICSGYYPVKQVIMQDFSAVFFDSLFRILSWTFLVHFNKTKYLYFFGQLSVRLEVIKSALENILESQISYKSCFLINEIVSKKISKNLSIHSQIITLKEIYYSCWLIQECLLQISGLFLLIYFIGYIGQLMYVIFFYVKISILQEKFFENLFEIILYFMVLNIFTISFFVTSHKIHSKGLKIAGLIHQISQNSIHDSQLVDLISLFSSQILQQPMNHINIYGIFYYDRSNINGIVILYSSLFYEAFSINVKLIDLKEKAKELGVENQDESLIT